MDIRLGAEQEAKLQELAAHTGQPANHIVNEAVDRLYEYDAWFRQRVGLSLGQLDRGEFVEDDAVRAWLDARQRP